MAPSRRPPLGTKTPPEAGRGSRAERGGRRPLDDQQLAELGEFCLGLAANEDEAERIMAATLERAFGDDAPELAGDDGRSFLRLSVIARIVATERRARPVPRAAPTEDRVGQQTRNGGPFNGRSSERNGEAAGLASQGDPARRRTGLVFRAAAISPAEVEAVSSTASSPEPGRERSLGADLPLVLTATVARLVASRSIPRRVGSRLRALKPERDFRAPALIGASAMVVLLIGGLVLALFPGWGSGNGAAPERILTTPSASGAGETTTTTIAPSSSPAPPQVSVQSGLLGNPAFAAFLNGLQVTHHTPFGASLFATLPALFRLPPVPPSPRGALPPPGPSENPPPNPPPRSGPPPTSPPPPPPTQPPPPPPPPPTTTTQPPPPPPTTTTQPPPPPPTTTTTLPTTTTTTPTSLPLPLPLPLPLHLPLG